MPEQLLSERDVAKIIGRAESTLQKDRVRGVGIPFIRVGRLVRYRKSEVAAYLAALPTFKSTSEADETGVRGGGAGPTAPAGAPA